MGVYQAEQERETDVRTEAQDADDGDGEPEAGHTSSFDAFYVASAPSLIRQLHAMTGDLGEAQDCVQEAYARAWQRWSRLGTYDSPEAWVRTVAWRLAVSRFRRARVGRGVLRREGPPDEVPSPGPEHVALVAALRQIPQLQRRAIVLHHLAGLSVEEVAAETSSPSGTVKARLSRGRAALAALLTDDSPEGASHG
jgi:RNA polymerase sigma-70 factor (ECF subfamily)